MIALTRPAPAKINLTLRVAGVRTDGYHEIESLVARVGLCDTIAVRLRPFGELALRCDDPTLPSDHSNLALRAAGELAAGRPLPGIEIDVRKRIPAGAGLGGGSSDAATTLSLLNEIWASGLDRAALSVIGARISSDVPLFFATPVCILRGRGVEIEDVPIEPVGWAVLVLPPIHSATAAVYSAWDRLDAHLARLPIESILAALRAGPANAMPILYNDLEPAAHAASPPLADFALRLRALTVALFQMSGSGSAYFTLTDDEPAARRLADHVHTRLGVRTEAVPLSTA